MKLANVYIEHSSLSLDQCFSYSFEGMNVLPGTRVWVPFRSMKLIGFVDSLSEISDEEVAASFVSDPSCSFCNR